MSKPHVVKLNQHERAEFEQLTRKQQKRYKNLRETHIPHEIAMLYVKEQV